MTNKNYGQVCVCPRCKFIYVSDSQIECENAKCPRFGQIGIMCDVIESKL